MSENNKGGAPTKYKPEYCEQAYKLCLLLGATDADLAKFFEVTEQTINNWKKDFSEFFESIKRGKEVADSDVAKRLYERAMGFEHDSEEIKIVSMGKDMGSEIIRVPIRKIYPPDTMAAIYWLNNRQKDKWKQRQDITSDGKEILNNITITFQKHDEKAITSEADIQDDDKAI